MAEPFLSEIRMFGFNFPPRGWATCDGQLLPINQNQALFSLLGTIYGGDGASNFALPDLRGRTPLHFGQGAGLTSRPQGQRTGAENVTLNVSQLPSHNHGVVASSGAASEESPASDLVLGGTEEDVYGSDSASLSLGSSAVAPAGGGQSHNNMQPCLTVNFCIALSGVFPSRN